MIDPLELVSRAVQKLRRKRKLSTELHPRWGDVSISYPTEGSWSQWDQQLGFVLNTVEVRSERRQSQRPPSRDSQGTKSQVPGLLYRSGSGGESPDDFGATTIPTGHHDAELRRQPVMEHRERRVSSRIGEHAHRGSVWESMDTCDRSDSDADSSTPSTSGRVIEGTRYLAVAEPGNSQQAPKSPPLSVTSHMRRYSQQSSITPEPTSSMPGTISSRTTSFAASSASGADDLRQRYSAAYQEKRQQFRSKYHGGPAPRQEMVPSYEELYE